MNVTISFRFLYVFRFVRLSEYIIFLLSYQYNFNTLQISTYACHNYKINMHEWKRLAYVNFSLTKACSR